MTNTTVVIPNYNGMKYITGCLHSLFKGEEEPKVIVVDNGSTDGSREWIIETYQNIQMITFPENKGFSAAVNAGIRAATTEYVFLLNDDTTVEEETIPALEAVMEQNADAFSVAAKMLNMNSSDKLDGAGDFYSSLGWAYARGKDKSADRYSRSGATRIFSACAGAALYRKKLFDVIGYFDENHFAYLEDLDIGYRANIKGYRNLFAPEAIVYHAGSGVSGSRHNEFKVSLSSRNSIYLIYKNMPLLQIIINLPFLILGYLIKTLFFVLKGLGGTYLKGLKEGFQLSFSKEGRENKVKFAAKNIGHYVWIQLQLWINIFRRLF